MKSRLGFVLLLVASAAQAKVTQAVNPPVIDEQPIARVVTVSGHATLSVQAHSSSAMTFQWWNSSQPLANNARISGATNAVLNIDPVQFSDSTNYFVVVSAGGASATSAVVSLVVTQLNSPRVTAIGSTGVLVSVTGLIGDVYRLESTSDFGITYVTNGYATNRSGTATHVDKNMGGFTFFRVALERMLPILYAPIVTNTQPVVRAYGKLNQSWRLEATTDFIQWTNVATIVNTTGWMRVTDTNAPSSNPRFYRISPP